MSFLDLFGGYWTAKDAAPSAENVEKRGQMAVLLKYSQEYMEKMVAFLSQSGTVVYFYVKENGDGSFTSGLEMGELSQSTTFSLNGEEVKVQGFLDGKNVMSCNSFEGGVWTNKLTIDGCPDTIITVKRVGEEMHTKTVLGDIEVEEVSVKSTA